MQQGFCNVKTAILEQGYQNQLGNERQTNQIGFGFNQMQNSFTNGFTSLGYQIQSGFNDVKQNECNQTQKIVDLLNGHWSQEQQTEIAALKAKVATMEQTQLLLQAINGGATAAKTTAAG
jgi:hypothetical protein